MSLPKSQECPAEAKACLGPTLHTPLGQSEPLTAQATESADRFWRAGGSYQLMLMALHRAARPILIDGISNRLGGYPSAVGRQLLAAREEGLVVIERDADHGRPLAALTDMGSAIAVSVIARFAAADPSRSTE